MDIAAWLHGLGLQQYESVFRDNDIDGTVLPSLTAEDLKDLGITSVGHRRRLLGALAALKESAEPAVIAPVPDGAAAPEAERRQLTVMFCDLVGSTELSTTLDPEDLREVIGAYHRCAAETVGRFAGFVAKYMGDRVLVYFGYPQAHEDDTERAVCAGLALIEGIGKIEAAEPLQVRVGIATGMVVVGDLIGAGAAQEQAVVGETPNLAARLQSLAQPGALLIDANTRRLVGDLFEFHDLGAVEVKGFPRAVPAWQVVRQSAVESRFEALRASLLTPLVGREEELGFLLDRWARAKDGKGQVVLVSGEAGIGKSRIAAVLVDRLREQPSFRLRYFCSSHYENSALYPVTAQLERGAGFARQDPLPTRLEKFRTLLTQSAATDDEAALIGELLSLPLPASGATAQLTAQRKKERTLEALVRQMEALSENRPLLMVWEDVHWIDPTSRELLDLTIARLRNLRVLLIITFRPEFEPPWIAQAHVGLLALSRLDAQDGTTLAEHVAGKSLPPAIVARIAARADGIPLFVEELTRALIETGSLPDDGSRYEPDHPALLAIPPSLHASLLARLDRLAQAREVAQIGAAIGREFSYELLSAVAGKGDQELQHALDQLVEAGLVFRRGEPPHTAHLFKHALVQDAAYGTLLRGPRQSLHRRIAIALENKFPEVAEARPELLAQHLMNAGLIDKAIKHWGKAAERSISRSAMAEALVHAERGLNLLSALPDGAALRSEELALQVALGRALMVVRGPSTLETGQALLRARELCRELDEADVLLQIMCGQYMYYQQAGQFEAAHKIGDDLLTFATERRDSRSISIAQFALGCTSLFQGDGIAAYSALEQCIIRPSVGETSAIFGWDVGAAAAAYLGVVLFCLGKLDQAMAQSHAAIEKASELAHPETEAVVTAVVCRTFWLARNYQALRQRSEVYDALIAEHDLTWFSVHSNLYRGWFQVEEGSAEEGLSLLERSLAAYRASGHGLGLPYMLAVYAAACQKAGRLEQAWKLLAEAAEVTEQSSERWFEPELERLKGKMLVAAGSAGEAEPHLEKAIALARARSAKSWELRAATCLARLWREQGRGAQARDLLAPVYGWFTEGFETADLKEAKALLHELIV